MLIRHIAIDTAFEAPVAPFIAHAGGSPERADALMAYGHAAAIGGSLVGIAGGFALVAVGALTPLVMTLLVSGPVGGMLFSALLYSAAARADINAASEADRS